MIMIDELLKHKSINMGAQNVLKELYLDLSMFIQCAITVVHDKSQSSLIKLHTISQIPSVVCTHYTTS